MKAVQVNKPETGGKRRRHLRPAFNNRKQDYEDTDQIHSRRRDAHHHSDRPSRVGQRLLSQQRHLRRPYHRSDYGSLGGSYGHSSGYSSGYVYRNPYAAYPSVHVRGYYRSSGTYVAPYVRTAPNWTPTDNLSYRGYGTVRVPRY